MDVASHVASLGGIAHRRDLADRGIGRSAIAAALATGRVACVRRFWIVAPGADPEFVLAARMGGRLACVSAARSLGLWTLEVDRPHVWVSPRSEVGARPGMRIHRSIPLAPAPSATLIMPVLDVLAQVATCRPREAALAIWEPAIRKRLVDPRALGSVAWRSLAARSLAGAADVLSDSGLETIGVRRVRRMGLVVRQQVLLLGHRVDALVEDSLVLQFDGWAHHSSAADRARDNRHDERLRAAGFHVIRIGYAEVVSGWAVIEREIQLAVAQGRHRRRRAAERWFA